ncbi:hypothetical protein [Celeribacter sp.]|uniref:hypothetical protein n=1 Tax=Celeribacter sp. TaxID=1890673 RepID=UPI003A8C9653
MSKKLIIIGNGLGMALDPNHFLLTNAMTRVWESGALTNEAKDLIGALKGIEPETGPRSETDLISTQIALSLLTDFRSRLGADALETWFTDTAKTFPLTLRKYVFEVAFDLYNYGIPDDKLGQWAEFTQSFIRFIMETKSHVATLNYDDLIYEKIVEGVCVDGEWLVPSRRQGVNGPATSKDGFISGEFRAECFDWGGDCGFYLHLHGTPLFATKDERNIKLGRNEVEFKNENRRRHIVLANPKDKRDIIDQSEILKNFWDVQLPRCIREAEEIIVFGYSGLDDHLNELLKESDKKKWVIEWSGSKHYSKDSGVLEGEEIDATTFWKDAVGDNCEVKPLGNILDFKEWDNPDDWPPF